MVAAAAQGELSPTTALAAWGRSSPLAAGFAASAVSVGCATFLTNWIDVIKTRQQMAGNASRNLVSTGIALVRDEGALSLYRGVTPAVARGLIYGGVCVCVCAAVSVRRAFLSLS